MTKHTKDRTIKYDRVKKIYGLFKSYTNPQKKSLNNFVRFYFRKNLKMLYEPHDIHRGSDNHR